MDRNLWLAVALSAGVYLIWYGYFDKRVNPPQPLATHATMPGSDAAAAAGISAVPHQDSAMALAQSDKIDLDGVTALINPRGAALSSYSPLPQAELVADASGGLLSTFPDLLFKPDVSVKTGIAYVATRPDGVRITKTFVPGQGASLPRLLVTATNPSHQTIVLPSWTLSIGPGLGTVESELKENAKLTRVIGLTTEGSGLKGRIEALKSGPHANPYRWVAVDNRYFIAALMPAFSQFEPVEVSIPTTLTLAAKPVTLSPRGSVAWEIPYYLGPKGYHWLERYGVGLERSVDLGWGFIAPIGRGMLTTLVWLHSLIGNWGWAIIALTLILQVFLAPLTYKSLKAAAAVRVLQPEISKLQSRYKDDPSKLNAEMMSLYKKSGANPLGGCMPTLMQMPIFYGLYAALRSSWELHGASWVFWIRDLSAKDPYYILPIIMGGLMFLQSKLNPPAGDPTQRQIMMFMPLIFTFMFLRFPAGLVLYWLTNSLVSTSLQFALRDRLNARA